MSIAAIAGQAKSSDLYGTMYSRFTDWHHWGPSGLSSALHQDGDSFTFTLLSPRQAIEALAAGFVALHQTCVLVNTHSRRGRERELAGIQKEFFAWGKGIGTDGR